MKVTDADVANENSMEIPQNWNDHMRKYNETSRRYEQILREYQIKIEEASTTAMNELRNLNPELELPTHEPSQVGFHPMITLVPSAGRFFETSDELYLRNRKELERSTSQDEIAMKDLMERLQKRWKDREKVSSKARMSVSNKIISWRLFGQDGTRLNRRTRPRGVHTQQAGGNFQARVDAPRPEGDSFQQNQPTNDDLEAGSDSSEEEWELLDDNPEELEVVREQDGDVDGLDLGGGFDVQDGRGDAFTEMREDEIFVNNNMNAERDMILENEMWSGLIYFGFLLMMIGLLINIFKI